MCGISGVFLKAGETANRELLSEMASRMQHRGPDSEGFLVSGRAGFAHRRLKIIDLSSLADQPFVSDDRKISLVFNGEIYNFKELREELQRAGRVFRSRSDTEVILRAYEAWGMESFKRLNGMFAFAILDERGAEPVLHLVRDRFGIKPLFYSWTDGRLAFSSELKPLLALDWIGKELDPDSVLCFIKFSHVPTPRSIFRGVKQLEAGCALSFWGTNSRVSRYYDPASVARSASEEKRTEAEWLDELDRTLSRVVRRQIESDVPIGCFLSGGIDSSLLASTYAGLGLGQIDTFTISYREREFDEGGYAKAVAQAIGSRHHDIPVEPKDLLELITEAPKFYDQPFADPTLLPTLILARKAREKVTVALSGDGGDELFFGYTYQRILRMLRPIAGMPQGLRRTLMAGASPGALFLGKRRRQQWNKFREILEFEDEAQLFQYFVGTVGPVRWDRLKGLMSTPRDLAPFSGLMNEIDDLGWTQKIDQVFLRTFLIDTVLAKTDRAGMAYGLEARVPFLDDELVAFSARLPFEYKLRRGQSKYLLRKLLEKKLPGEHSKRKKQGFSIPLRDWLRGELKPLLLETLETSRLARDGIFNPQEVKRLVDEHLSDRANHSHLLFSLISFQLWKERYLA